MNFKDLKKNNIEILTSKVMESERVASAKDTRFWNLTKGKDGTGQALIRFLPAPQGEDLCWAKYYENRFDNQATKKYYSAVSPTTFNLPCPVSEFNNKMWNSGEKPKQEFVSRFTKRKEVYVFNIYVIKDPGNPESEGQVFLWKCGKKIFEKIKSALADDPMSDRKAFDPFNMWEGRNFILNMKQVAGYNNYDDSKFAETSSALLKGDEALLEKVWLSQHSLKEFVDHTKVLKPYEKLKAKLEEVLENMPEYRTACGGNVPANVVNNSVGSPNRSTDRFKKTSVKSNTEESPFEDNSDEGESSSVLDLYKKLADEG